MSIFLGLGAGQNLSGGGTAADSADSEDEDDDGADGANDADDADEAENAVEEEVPPDDDA